MWNFIDESGSFSWVNPGTSLFCGLSIPDREIHKTEQRFLHWKKSVIGNSRRELKGEELAPTQLISFARNVLPLGDTEASISLVGANTERTPETFIVRLRDQASEIFRLASELCVRERKQNMANSYGQMSGWINNRSTVNVFWLIALEETIFQTMQHSVIRFLGPEYDAEFEKIEIVIDQSFIKRDEHILFWREWLRNGLMKSSRKGGFVTVKDWSERKHPFYRKYIIAEGLYDFKDLFVKHTGFHDSREYVGLQVADICANICYREFRDAPDLEAYQYLRPRIMGKDGREITSITVDERSLHQGDLSQHVKAFDLDEWKAAAAQRNAGGDR